MSANSNKVPLAFLGPAGTYTHQAALECFGDSVEYTARPTIAAVQQALSADVPFGIIPQENSTNGLVAETYDLLRIPPIGQETFVRGVTVIGVRHSLVIRQGVKMEDIETVLSHEQALGQCREWLAVHLPRAALVRTDSTAAAAKRLLEAGGDLDPTACAAICSSVVVSVYEGLEVLADGIQDGPENFTRFYILSWGLNVALPGGCTLSTENKALLRVQTFDLAKPALDISRVIRALNFDVLRIDRHPTIHAKSSDDIYFLEVEAALEQGIPGQPWTEQLQQAVHRVKRMGAEVSVLGCW